MSNQRTHHITTTDGVTIGGTVHGQGQPLVFVHGIMGDGDLDWQGLLPHLTDRFTCYLPSYRGRGLSGDHPDLSPGRIVDDIVAYVASIGQPTALAGFSLGGGFALGAAARSDALAAVAVYEPALPPEVWAEQQRAGFGDTVARMAELAAAGELTATSLAWAEFVFHDKEVVALDSAGYLRATGRYMPVVLNGIRQAMQSEAPTSADPEVLGRISVPALVLYGSDTTNPLFAASVRHVDNHVPDATVREMAGAGHAAPLTHPEALAEALTDFFSAAQQPA